MANRSISDVRDLAERAAAPNPYLKVRVPMLGMFRLQMEHPRHGTHVLYEFLNARDGWRHRVWNDAERAMPSWRPVWAAVACEAAITTALVNAGMLDEHERLP